jgi:basic membrane protein A and related proteins
MTVLCASIERACFAGSGQESSRSAATRTGRLVAHGLLRHGTRLECQCGGVAESIAPKHGARVDYRGDAIMADFSISRRRLLQTGLAGGGLALAGIAASRRAAAADVSVGFIYVGPRDDFGYNQAHAQGAAAVKRMGGVKVLEEENVPETLAVAKTMESMIELDDAKLLFPTSFGYYNPHVVKESMKYPDVRFEHCGGLWTEKDPGNAASYFGYIDECCHLSGIVAGYSTKTGKLGFVAAKPIPQVLRNINAFTLGARMANPKATTQVIFTGDWSLPVKEAESTNSLIGAGIDVVTCHVDSPKVVVETAERRGAMVCGYHTNQAPLAPHGFLTGAEWNWEDLYPKFVKMFTSGKTIPNLVRGGLKEGIVKPSAYSSLVSGKARKHADDVKARLIAGTYVIFKGPIKDNKGNMVIASGIEQHQTDISLEQMSYLVEGVLGATS